ncbi:MAG: SDR family NAD(P)-dependent oxidoreductase [Acidimicrobiia bacterium]
MQNLSGKVAVVTGAAGGIGLGMARALVDDGVRVVLADIDEGRLEGAVDGLTRDGADVIGVPTDVAVRDSVEALRSTALDHFDEVHLLCSNAGVPFRAAAVDLNYADWNFVLGVYLYGVVKGIRAFLPDGETQREGHLNATSSMNGLVPFPPVVAYNVAGFGVIALMETLERELRASGSPVEVSVLCPGEVATHGIEHSVELA